MKMKIISRAMVELPVRRKNSRKGENGRVLVVGGSPEYIGSLSLSGVAALRAGADSVVVAAPAKVAWAVNCLSADLVTKKLWGNFLSARNYREIRKYFKADCLLIGGGVEEHPQSMRLMRKIIGKFQGRKILDAAALFAFEPKTLRNAILTPNQKEFGRLKKYCDINQIIKNGNIIVAKSPRTKIITKNQIFENRTGNAGLTKAGTGDVLAGLTAGFVAQSKNLLQSAVNGVYYLGVLGDIMLKKKKGYSYLASDLAEEIRGVKNLL